jgi:hypothetical protein
MLGSVVGGEGRGRKSRARAGIHHDPGAGRHRAAAPSKSRLPRIGLVLLLAACVVGTVSWFFASHTVQPATPRSISAPAPPAPKDADDWMRANLPTSSRLLTDGTAAPVGYPTSSMSEAQNWRDFDYLLTTQTGAPLPDAAAAPVWPWSTPVALFDGLQVRHIASDEGPDATPVDTNADLADRKRAGEALLLNPHLNVSAAARSELEKGNVDLRVGAVLSGLSSQFDLALQDVTPVPVEASAGTPARQVTIYTPDTGRAMRNLNAFDPALKPDRIVVGEFGAIGLHWPLSFSPIPSVN